MCLIRILFLLTFTLIVEGNDKELKGKGLIISKLDKYFKEQMILNSQMSLFDNGRFILVLCSSEDFPESKKWKRSKIYFTKDIDIPMNKQMYVFRIGYFLALFSRSIIMNEIFKDANIMFLIDDVRVKMTIPQILRDSRQTLLVLSYVSRISFSINSKSIFITSDDTAICFNERKIDSCGSIFTNQEFFISKKKQRVRYTIKPNEDPPPEVCNVSIVFINYNNINDHWKAQVGAIKAHYLYDFMSQVSDKMNLKLNIISFTVFGGAYSLIQNNSDVNLVGSTDSGNRFIFNTMHWIDNDKINHMSQLPPDGFTFLMTDDILWMIVNQKSVFISLKAVTKAFFVTVTVISILGVSTIISKRHRKLHALFKIINDGCVLTWSILLSVSIPKQPSNYFLRCLFMSWVIASSTFTMCYYVKILNVFTSPIISKISNQSELLSSGIPLVALSEEYIDIALSGEANSSDKYDIEVYFNRELSDFRHNLSYIDYVQSKIKSGKTFALLMDKIQSQMIVKQNPGLNYYYIPKPVISYPVHFIANSINDFSMKVKKQAERLIECGVLQKVIDDHLGSFASPRGQGSPYIGLSFFYTIYVLMGYIYLFAFFVFICEICYYRAEVKYKLRKEERQNSATSSIQLYEFAN